MDWVRACKENASSRVQTKSNFSEAGPFNEMIVMGVLAVRLQSLNRTLKWDGNNMQFTNIGDNEMIKTCIKDGFTIKDGHPSFAKDWTDPVNAIAMVGNCLICLDNSFKLHKNEEVSIICQCRADDVLFYILWRWKENR